MPPLSLIPTMVLTLQAWTWCIPNRIIHPHHPHVVPSQSHKDKQTSSTNIWIHGNKILWKWLCDPYLLHMTRRSRVRIMEIASCKNATMQGKVVYNKPKLADPDPTHIMGPLCAGFPISHTNQQKPITYPILINGVIIFNFQALSKQSSKANNVSNNQFYSK